jgi:putative two-component system response regulator
MTDQGSINVGGRESVLIVDDAAENLRLLATLLRRNGIEPRPVTNGRRAIEAAVADPPDLILLDIAMPEMSGFEVCRWLKMDERLASIPVIFLSAHQTEEDKVQSFEAGGIDFIAKPFYDREIEARVRTHLQLRKLQGLLEAHNRDLRQRVYEQVSLTVASHLTTIFALAKLSEVRDDETGHHIERVQELSRILAREMRAMDIHASDLSASYVDSLYQAACLHDIGKVAIPDAILLKPGVLSPEEFETMKKHCALGAETLAAVVKKHPDNQFLHMGVDVARSHHEMWAGGGYPDGLSGNDIPLSARIVAIADVYDALTSRRSYRPAFSHIDAVDMIRKDIGVRFDPDVGRAFLRKRALIRRVKVEWGALTDPS